MIIGNNLARAFGLVGALSIIRFRTAIKDTSDIVYIFLSLTLGMAAGVGYYQLSFLGTLIIGAVLIIFSQTTNGIFSRNHYLLQFLYTGTRDSGSQPFVNVLEQYLSRYEVMNVRSDEINAAVVYSFFVKFKKNKEPDRLVDELRGVAGVRDINLFFDQQAV
jgi:uncharacterized membrane protein YhiD involved in acid resistance